MSLSNKIYKPFNFRRSRHRRVTVRNSNSDSNSSSQYKKHDGFWNNKYNKTRHSRNSFNISYCSNCGFKGHTYKNCNEPKISLGIIAFQYCENIQDYKFLLICRKHTLGFVELIRGKYSLDDQLYIQRLIDQLTIHEKNIIQTTSFIDLWNILWYSSETEEDINDISSKKQKKEYHIAKDKFILLRNGYILKEDTHDIYENIDITDIHILYEPHERELFTHISLTNLINKSDTIWNTPEWGFPKGRRNLKETNLECSKREFMEETGISEDNIEIFYNVNVPEEIFNGTNDLPYKHIYYLGRIKDKIKLMIDKNKKSQASEIGDLGFYTLDDCLQKIRPYNKEKVKILLEMNSFVHTHKLNNKSLDFYTNVSTYNFKKGGKLVSN